MKKLILLASLLVTSLSAQEAEAWVRQTDLATGQIYDTPIVGNGGTYTAPVRVNETGSLYELFARGTAWDNNIYLLDTELIGTYNPQVAITIATEDDYVRGDPSSGNFVRRTRADRPFTVQIEVEGLVEGSTSTAERSVYLAVQGRNADAQTYSLLDQPQYLMEDANLENGSYTLGPLYHQLTSPTLSAGNGEQSFTIVRYASFMVPDTILAQPKVEVWPVAAASIGNIADNQVFIDRIPTVVITLENLYPDSYTYVQYYQGGQVLGTEGTVVGNTERRFGTYYNPHLSGESTNVPQNLSISIDDLSNYASDDGIYTLEVITRTPFFGRAAERLAHVTFEVDRVISSRGQISTKEVSANP
ncbi:hypothetical protein WJU23_20875 [Prosthecobacter sp. SYSU 5D2]|uniref:hypothetical protein n=1 Tax=Prosthecobacter sp. SYSU 5D2 TaxID=3134134 RepID=UPI0031FF2A5C